ncbi:Phosphoglycerate mutase [Gordonia bronchialis DSM 43247]|uniref:Phosphoglycerate mutase n=1 Tax=Gordonia bronchialis (strain ATCC 25592 / DSM 43247 / BCRC 13721 / JCM 3198 / KCTC 3076 / NBRC 16047 / NCTC 10667) TaxID=526226 RepID=D0LB07_GORB4|nr:histidine phosphatase family protein [Gordonia bronchialis]ACY22300.1 Phosphoglycerate mutase [Gordonia bronchialis DSM 43247]MCC3325091.1 histidine phosphatase family protein [Gordonia bronchialis]QGS24168.1 histidine phosphatase family protein [Gordonia bronchialis]UAK39641.1 histidine phosphatase family protein [Gordonia bronchialis]STQ65226.1 bifunctional RNase H/acid phosphatase [Gordonia bronchialis]
MAPSWQGQRGAATRVILLRHGQTALSVDRRYSGRGNPELTETGRRQAQAAAAAFGSLAHAGDGEIAAVVSSPLRRTLQTAGAVAERIGVDVDEHEGLIETDFGEWEGLTFTEAAARDPHVHARWLGDVEVPAPGGESFAAVAKRVSDVKDELVQRYPGQTVVVVSHVTPIKSLLREALRVGPELLFRLHLDLASISIAEFFDDGGSVVRLVNDTSHLR